MALLSRFLPESPRSQQARVDDLSSEAIIQRQRACTTFWEDALDEQFDRGLDAVQKRYPGPRDALPKQLSAALVPVAQALVARHTQAENRHAPEHAGSDLCPTTRAAIVALGGQVEDIFLADPELPTDVVVIAVKGPREDNAWCAFHTSRDRIGHASEFFHTVVTLLPRSDDATAAAEIVPPWEGAEASLVKIVLDALYHREVAVTQANCVELATLIDYLGVRGSGPLHALHKRCAETFRAAVLTAENFLPLLQRLVDGGTAQSLWVDKIASFVSHSIQAHDKVAEATEAQLKLLLPGLQAAHMPSRTMLALACNWSEARRQEKETCASAMHRHGLGPYIPWSKLPLQTIWDQDARGFLTDADLARILRDKQKHLTEISDKKPAGSPLTWFSRSRNTDVELTLDSSAKGFTVHWNPTNFRSFVTTPLYSPTFTPLAGTGMKLSIQSHGFYLYPDEGLPVRGHATFVIHHAKSRSMSASAGPGGKLTWQCPADTLRIAGSSSNYGHHWPVGAVTQESLLLNNSPWLNANKGLSLEVSMRYSA